MAPTVLAPHRDTDGSSRSSGGVLDPRRRAAVPALHVQRRLRRDLHPPQCEGQPAVISWVITNVGNFIEPHIAVWNTFFALIQLAIGVGLLFRRTVRPALAVSFAWAFGVWVFGEGLGMILTGSATALTGAPGSVLIYGLIGLMAWPRPRALRSRRWAWPRRPRPRTGWRRDSTRWSGAATGRWRRCCSSSRRTGPRRRSRVRSRAWHRGSRAGSTTS